jgi:hypothetical protein
MFPKELEDKFLVCVGIFLFVTVVTVLIILNL